MKNLFKFSKKFSEKIINPTPKESYRQYIQLRTKFSDDFMQISNMITNNFIVKNNSQIYSINKEKQYFGYFEIEDMHKMNDVFIIEKLNNIAHNLGIEPDEVNYELLKKNSVEGVNMLKFLQDKNEVKKCSMFNNNKKTAFLFPARVYWGSYFVPKGELTSGGFDRNDDYGYLLDRVILIHKIYISWKKTMRM
jgi:hypothetical protein